MRYSLKILRHYIKGTFEENDIKDWLSRLGLNPVLSTHDGDVFIEIEVPANRGDLLSALGIIRAVSPFGKIEPIYPDRRIKEEIQRSISVEIESLQDCNFYAGRIIEGVNVSASPDWLKERIIAAGFRSINNVVDITNLVLWEFGHPLHAFDLDLLKEKIVVRRAMNGEEIISLDGEKRTLSSEVLVIADAEKPIAIAGIMGGLNTEVSEKTKNLFIESAFFSPSRIRRGSKFLGLTTDASARFEKQADASLVIPALDRCCKLIQEVCGGKISILCSAGKQIAQKKTLVVHRKKVDSYLGCEIPEDFSITVLKKLGFFVNLENGNLKVELTQGRNDIERDVDIIEEIAKYWGYDKIPERMPCASIAYTCSSPEFIYLDELKDIVVRLGFTEVINHGLTDKNELDFSSDCPVEIINPLSKNYSFLRNSLVPGILKNLRDNHNVKIDKISIFEIGNIYCVMDSQPSERPAMCLASMNCFDLFSFRGKIETLLKVIGYDNISPSINRCSEGTIINFSDPAGSLKARLIIPSEDILNKYDLEQENVLVCEVFLTDFVKRGFLEVTFKPLPKILPLSRDLSLLIPDSVNWAEVERFLYESVEFLQDVKVFDIYRGKNIPAGTTSVSITVVLSNADGKLTREKVDEIIKALIGNLEKKFSITLRK